VNKHHSGIGLGCLGGSRGIRVTKVLESQGGNQNLGVLRTRLTSYATKGVPTSLSAKGKGTKF